MAERGLGVLLVILDGLGDSGSAELGGKTPLESVEQRNLGRFKEAGAVGLIDPISPGIPPGSDTSHLSLFGYDISAEYPGRGPFEAAGNGIELREGEIAFRANFATVELRGGRADVVDRRAGRIPTEATARLAKVLNEECGQVGDARFRLYPALEHRAVLVISGTGLSHQVTDNDPHATGMPLLECLPLEEASDKEGAGRLCRLVNSWERECIKVLERAEENADRKRRGLLPGNAVLLRSPGVMRAMQPFSERWGFKAACVAGGKLYKGIAKMLGMDVVEVPGATGMPDTDIGGKVRASLKLLGDHDFVYLHLKGTDVCSHKGDARGKAEFLRRFDDSLDEVDSDFLSSNVLAVTGDHSTPCGRAMHSGEPVPLLVAGKHVRSDNVRTFSELSATGGNIGRIRGRDLMPLLLDAAKRTVELGTRPTPRRLNFIPRDLVPLDLGP
ncbi:MAG: 2,3-bisphosphoglycerate-independent phosphoglycerate mutase [Candidatus Brockarchaeota archaeon]|nr:2,3-bisphosphoglycerate-independent phosphoglycerate mutase [Candidatus Brockarchaeota archaeon]